MNFDYSFGEDYAKKLGLNWWPEWVVYFDQQAGAHGFTQSQVDIAIQHHLWQVRHIFDARSYSFRQRLYLALHFLIGKKLKDVSNV